MPEFRSAGLLIRVRSEVLGGLVWFASDNALVPPEVPRGRLYYAAELERLIEQWPTPSELRRVAATKEVFAGRVA